MTNQKVSNEQIDQKLNLILEHLKFHEKRFDEIDRKFDGIERRFDQIDQRFEKIDQRFDEVDAKIDKVDGRVAGLETSRVKWHGWLLALAMGATVIINLVLTRIVFFGSKLAFEPTIVS